MTGSSSAARSASNDCSTRLAAITLTIILGLCIAVSAHDHALPTVVVTSCSWLFLLLLWMAQFALLPAADSSLSVGLSRSPSTNPAVVRLRLKDELKAAGSSSAPSVPSADEIDPTDLSGDKDSASLLDLAVLRSRPKLDPLLFEHDDATAMSWLRCPASRERGVVLLFHGCSHSSEDWFQLPEEVATVRALLAANYSAVAFSSADRTRSKCWDDTWPEDYGSEHPRSNRDVDAVLSALNAWMAAQSMPAAVASTMFAMGASSGGTFVSILSRAMPLRGAVVMISPGSEAALLAPEGAPVGLASSMAGSPAAFDPRGLIESRYAPLPPLLFLCMSRDLHWASERAITYTRGLILNANPRLNANASTGRPARVDVWTIQPRALRVDSLVSIDDILASTPECSHLFYCLGHARSDGLAARVSKLRPQEEANGIVIDPTAVDHTLLHPSTHQLQHDPRLTKPLLTVQAMMKQLQSAVPSTAAPPLRFSAQRYADAVALHSAATLSTCADLFVRHSAAIEELLNERWANHELSARFIGKQIEWMETQLELDRS